MSDQQYYYSDRNFQLELNLQEIRRELITFLEILEDGCFQCNKLKCSCAEKNLDNTATTSTMENSAIGSTDAKQDGVEAPKTADEIEKQKNNAADVKSPPASSLPKPEWDTSHSEKNPLPPLDRSQPKVEAWISTLNDPELKKQNGRNKERIIVYSQWPATKPAYTGRVDSTVDSPVKNFFDFFSPNSPMNHVPQVNRSIPPLMYQMNVTHNSHFGCRKSLFN